MIDHPTFPFGAPSTARLPRRPTGEAKVLLLGVYPSALHVRWQPPAWALDLKVRPVAALAVDDEPIVFWDGEDADHRVDEWRSKVQFRAGDDEGDWGHVQPSGNGTSGRPVVERVLEPLGVSPGDTWFTDVVDHFFIKTGSGKRRGQADVIAESYAPFAREVGLPQAVLPARPSVKELVALATTDHAKRLRAEIEDAAAPVVITLGEEARRVLLAISDDSKGPPTAALDSRRLVGAAAAQYGEQGSVRVGGQAMAWHALVHPGQRSATWRALHDGWVERRST